MINLMPGWKQPGVFIVKAIPEMSHNNADQTSYKKQPRR